MRSCWPQRGGHCWGHLALLGTESAGTATVRMVTLNIHTSLWGLSWAPGTYSLMGTRSPLHAGTYSLMETRSPLHAVTYSLMEFSLPCKDTFPDGNTFFPPCRDTFPDGNTLSPPCTHTASPAHGVQEPPDGCAAATPSPTLSPRAGTAPQAPALLQVTHGRAQTLPSCACKAGTATPRP